MPPLPVILQLVVCALALANAGVGFLQSAQLTRGSAGTVPLGSVYAVAGWIPALLVVSGLVAAATRLKGVSVPTLWAVSAATAVMGGVGALFYLVAREGADAGLGYALSAANTVDSRASAGLVLAVLFGLLQMAAALGCLLLTQSPHSAGRTAGAASRGSDADARRGPNAAAPPAPGYPAYAYGPRPGGPARVGPASPVGRVARSGRPAVRGVSSRPAVPVSPGRAGRRGVRAAAGRPGSSRGATTGTGIT